MTDTVELPPTEAEIVTDAKREAANPTNPCFCQAFEIDSDGSVFSTGCEKTTARTFAQGHDASLVSFLVNGYFDGYSIRAVVDGQTVNCADPEEAAGLASKALGDKAARSTAKRRENDEKKATAKAEREAKSAARKAEKQAAKDAKAAEKAAAKAAGAEVVAGTSEGDPRPVPEGKTRIKVGRWEYDAEIDADEVATYTDGAGDLQTVERDGYRVI